MESLEAPDAPDRLAHFAESPGNIEVFSTANSCHPKGFGARDSSISSTNYGQGKLAQFHSAALRNNKSSLSRPSGVCQTAVATDIKEGMERTEMNTNTHIIPNGPICKAADRKKGKILLDENSESPETHGSIKLLDMRSSLLTISEEQPHMPGKKAILQDDACASRKERNKGKEVHVYGHLHPQSCKQVFSGKQTDVSQQLRERQILVHNGHISPCNIIKPRIASEVHCQNGMISSDGRKNSSSAGIGDLDKSKGCDISDNIQLRKSLRRLVKNGPISQGENSDRWTVRKAPDDKMEEIEFIRESSTSRISDQTDHVIPDSRGRYNEGNRQKLTADASIITKRQLNKTNLPLKRPYTAGEVVTIYEENDSCTPNTSRRDVPGQRNEDATRTRSHLNIFLDNSKTFAMPGSSVESSFSKFDTESRRKRHAHLKRRSRSTTSKSYGENSNSAFDVPEVTYMGTSSESSNSRSARACNSRLRSIILRPFIEIDELHSPDASSINYHELRQSASDNTDASARQIESDELLAHRLQEQFYNESLGTGDREEMHDEAIAWSLQHEENAQHTSLASGRVQHGHRRRLTERRHSRRPSRNYIPSSVNNGQHGSFREAARLIRDLSTHDNTGTHRRVNSREDRSNSSSNTRMVFSHNLHGQRDFNEGEYEMLLALDDNNHQHTGGSEYLINDLPRSIVQTDNIEEPCAVCLEKPSAGETIRHLPCFHKFHKDCIDQWLRRKMSCPVCKSGITIT